MTAFRCVASCANSSKERNEDAVGFGAKLAWAVDGASPLTAAVGFDAADYVASITLAARATSAEEWTAAKHLEQIWAQSSRVETVAELLPSAGIAIAAIVGASLDLAVLGDVAIVVEGVNGETEFLIDSGILDLDEQVIDKIAAGVRAGRDFADVRFEMTDQLIRHRRLMNRPGGYWVMDPVVNSTSRAVHWTRPVDAVRSVSLVTDGFARVVDFGIRSGWDAVVAELRASGTCADIINELRSVETRDHNASQFPRLSIHDDASIIMVEPLPSR